MNGQKLLKIINKADGTWGMVVRQIGRDSFFEHNKDLEFPAASVGKVWIALYVFHLVDAGAARLDRRFEIKKEYYRGGTGILRFLTPGLRPTLEDIIKLMLITSDNTAAKFLVKNYGPEKINGYLISLGFKKTQLGIRDKKFDYGTTTAGEITDLLEGICTSRFLSKKYSKILIDIMKKCDNQLSIRRYLPRESSGGKKLEIADKGGALPGIRHDVGIVFTKQPYVISVLSKDLKDISYKPENEGVLAIARLSDEVYRQLKAGKKK